MKPINEELAILDRMIDMLSEYSVEYLAEQDIEFGGYVKQLYSSLINQSYKLESTLGA